MPQNPKDFSFLARPARVSQLPRLCVPLGASGIRELLARLGDLSPAFQFVELRLDYLEAPEAALPALAAGLQEHPGRIVLVTCRPRRSGGQFAGGPEKELAVLLAAAQGGAPMVDLSLESAEELGPESVVQLRAAGATVLVSFHDFDGMGDLGAVLRRMQALSPDLIKLVPTACSLNDSLDLLRLLDENRNSPAPLPLVAVAMGEAGALTRLLGLQSGSRFTFAPVTEAEATAPGQIAAPALRELFRVETWTATTRLFGVAGDPVRSSLSPLMFNTVFRETGADAAYLPLLTRDPGTLLRAARDLPLDGCSVTMPLKQAVLPLLASVEPLAQRIGAVNTLQQRDGQFHGYNTDVEGIVLPLEQRLSLRGARVLVLGAGGAARAAVFGCTDRGARVSVANRSPERAAALAAEAGAHVLPLADLAHERFDVLVHATPAGMKGSGLELPLAPDQLRADLVFDLVYNPMETPLLQLAREQGLAVIAGLEMFLHQGARQYELWTGSPAPFALMEATVREALARREAGQGVP